MGIKERLHRVDAGSKISLSLQNGWEISGYMTSNASNGILFEGVIPYDLIKKFKVLPEELTENETDDIRTEAVKPEKDETIVIRKKDGSLLLGRYISEDVKKIFIEKNGKKQYVKISDVECLYLCGIITEYRPLNKSGKVNNLHKFNKEMVDIDSSIFKRLDRSNSREKNRYMCLYKMENNTITSLDDFDDIIEQIPWQGGDISAASPKNNYFTVDDEARCYFGAVDDHILFLYRDNNDLQKQDVFYREVYHRCCDEQRKKGVSASIVDIRSKYQIGKVNKDDITKTTTIQCGKYHYRYQGEEFIDNPFVVAELGIDNGGQELVVTRITKQGENEEDLMKSLPTNKNDLEIRRKNLKRERQSAEAREAYSELFEKTKEQLKENLLSPEEAFKEMIKASINDKKRNGAENALDEMESVFWEKGYLLPENLRHVFEMQICYLQGEYTKAKKQAEIIIKQKSRSYKAEYLFQAKGVLSEGDSFSIDELETWIIHSGADKLVGIIDNFDLKTNCGLIRVDNQQYKFHWKDVETVLKEKEFDLREKQFDFRNNRYIVTFHKEDKESRANQINLRVVLPYRASVIHDETGDDYDAALENVRGIPDNTFLTKKLENYSLNDIKEFLSLDEQKKIKDGVYQGEPEEIISISSAMEKLHDENEWDDRYFSKGVPTKEKSRLLLARAKIISQYLDSPKFSEYGNFAGKLDKDVMNRALYEYAYDYISGCHLIDGGMIDRPAGTMAYFAYSILSTVGSYIPKDNRNEVVEYCIARYYKGGWQSFLDKKRNRMLSDSFWREECVDIKGLFQMLLSFPEKIFDDLLDQPLYAGMVKALRNEIPEIQKTTGDSPEEQVLRFYDAWHDMEKTFLELNESCTGKLRGDASNYLELLNDVGSRFIKQLFDDEQNIITKIEENMNSLLEYTDDETPDKQCSELPKIYRNCQDLLDEIDNKPTKLNYEVLRPFIEGMSKNIIGYLKDMYEKNAPEIVVKACCLSDNNTKAILCLTNEGKLSAKKIHIDITPFKGRDDFDIDKNIKLVPEFDFKADPEESVEIIVPIRNIKDGAKQLEMEVDVKYDYVVDYNTSDEREELEEKKFIRPVQVVFPLSEDDIDLISKDGNHYSRYAGGNPMEPKDEKMFFGREQDIDEIFRDIMCEDGISVKRGNMTAFYGQKRSGKTSIMNFLEKKIEDANPKAIVLRINVQGYSAREDKPYLFMQTMLSNITGALQKTILKMKYKDIRTALGSKIPTRSNFVDNIGAEATFLEFFQEFDALFGLEYPIVVMVDEFTQVYLHLKEKKIQADFLTQWRALVTELKFSCVLVGQDFMPQFFEDPSLSRGVNGLSTTNMFGIGYLDRDSAYRMMEEPIRRKDGSSRFQGNLGEKAKKRIFNLTGGSAYYIMKFMNGLVDYMIDNHNDLVTPSLIDKVLDERIFVMRKNAIEKKDFDPIYNEYSSSLAFNDKPKETDTLKGQEKVADRVYQFFIEIARYVSEHEKENGICNVAGIQWEDDKERDAIIRMLRDREILADKDGHSIIGKELKGLEFKAKVGLFVEFLKRRVLN